MWRGGALFGDRGAGETHLELLGVNGAGAVRIEEVEGLTDLLDLVVGETLWLGWGTAGLREHSKMRRGMEE